MDYEKKQTWFLILLVMVIILMVITITTLVKNKDLIMKDTLIYGMELHNFTSCSCYDSDGKLWYSTETGFTTSENSYTTKWPKMK